jgi:hypothetical protein
MKETNNSIGLQLVAPLRYDFCAEAASRLREVAETIRREADATVSLTTRSEKDFEEVTISVRRSLR